MHVYTNTKMPRFFIEAKGYDGSQVMPINDSLVNKLRKVIKRKQLSFKNIDMFSYRKLMHDSDNTYVDPLLIKEYRALSATYHNRINIEDDEEKYHDNIPYLIHDIKSKLLEFGYSAERTADMLVRHLYAEVETESKMILWACFGDILLENIKRKINPRETYCKRCGKRFTPRANAHRYCGSCFIKKIQKPNERIVVCSDCGKEFLVPKSVRNKKRCDECQAIERRRYEREKKRKQREKAKDELNIIFIDD